jgi:uncharacterized membrane protein
MAGFLRYEFNKWLFFPCSAGKSTATAKPTGMPFIDGTPGGTLFKAIQQRWQQSVDPLRGVYLEFSGYEESDRVAATEFWRALGWVSSCKDRPNNIAPSVILWAAGNEPSWNFTADARGARFRVPGETTLDLTPGQAHSEGRTLAWDGTSKTARLRIEFTADLCSDTMSEAAFGRSVVVAVAGQLYRGCGFVRR